MNSGKIGADGTGGESKVLQEVLADLKRLHEQEETHQAALTRHLSHYSQDDSVHSRVAPNLKET